MPRGGEAIAKTALPGNPAKAAELDHEADVMRAFPTANPHLAHLLWSGTTSGDAHWIVEQKVGRPASAGFMERAHHQPRLAVDFIENVLRGVRGLNNAGFVHRDLHIHNIMMKDDDPSTAAVIDFGTAINIGEWYATGGHWNMAAYQAPERKWPPGQVVARPSADVFSIGVHLANLLTGHLPYQVGPGEELNPQAWRRQYNLGPDLQMSPQQRAALPPGLLQVVRTALAVDPAERYQSAQEFIDALQPFA
jgi:serine/threonine-protein kinase